MDQVVRLFKWFCLLAMQALSVHAFASSGITYHGRIVKPDTTPVTSNTTQFRVQIRTPGTENCLLWEEQQTKDLSSTNGVFTLTIADNSEPSLIANILPFALERVFSNRTNYTGLTGCSVGSTYNPSTADGRNLQVFFRELPTDPWEQMPLTKINFVPMSLNSVQLEGFRATEFLKIDPLSSYTPLTAANVDTLEELIAGTNTQYLRPSTAFVGDVTGTYNTTVVEKIRGTNVVATAPTLNQVLKFNGTNWAPAADDTGVTGDASYAAKGVVQFDTNLATSGISVTAGVASLPNTIVAAGPIGGASSVPVITYDSKGRLTSVTTATVDDTTKLPLAGGTMTGAINMGGFNITNATSIAATNFSGRNLVLNDNDTNTVTVRTPADISANYVLQLPPDDGTSSGQVLTTDGAGILTWTTPASGISVTANQAVIANGTGTALTSFSCALNQVMGFDGAGLPQCQNVSAAGGFLNGGNSYGAAATLGTNDNFDLNIETNGTTKMSVLANGNVGIGTTTPTHTLEVNGNAYVDSGLITSGSGYVQTPTVATNNIDIKDAGASLSFNAYGGSPTRMAIDLNGNVGIGTTSPNSILDITGAFSQRGMAAPAVSPAGQGRIYFDSTANKFKVSENNGAFVDLVGSGSGTVSGTTDRIAKFTSGTAVGDSIIRESSNQIGIGTAPSTVLDVSGNTGNPLVRLHNQNASGLSGFDFRDDGASYKGSVGYDNADNLVRIESSSTDPLVIDTNGAERMRINSAGLVGIGTTNPTSMLHVENGAGNAEIKARTTAFNDVAQIRMHSRPGGPTALFGQIGFYDSGTGDANSANILAIRSDDGMGGGSESDLAFETVTDQGGQSPTEKMRIMYNGNIGMGTSTPNTRLDINGALSQRGMAAPAVSPAGQGRIYFDSTSNTFKVSQNNGAYVDLVGSGSGTVSGTTGKIAKFTSATAVGDSVMTEAAGNVGIGGNTLGGKLDVIGGAIRLEDGQSLDFGCGSLCGWVGLYGAAGNHVSLMTNGSDRVRANYGGSIDFKNESSGVLMSILMGGNVGIGTTAPNTKMDVRGSNAKATTAALEFISQAASTDANPLAVRTGVRTHATAGNRYGAIQVDDNGTARSLVLQPNGGNVGVGVTSPSANLDVRGTNGGGLDMFKVSTGASAALVVDQWQHVGVGMATPGAQLDVLNDDGFGILAGNFVASDPTNASGVSISTASNSTSNFGLEVLGNAGARTDLYVRSDGNVGIGTGTPNTVLDVNGAISQRGMAAPAVSPAGQGRIYFDSTANKFRVSQNNGAYTDLIPTGGTGDILNGGNTMGAAVTIGTNDNFALNFETNGTNKLSILADGNVGIGTTNPTEKLELSGSSSDGVRLRIQNSNASGYSSTTIYDSAGTNRASFGFGNASVGDTNLQNRAYIWTGNSTDFVISNLTNGPLFTINSTGNVGIGTTSPTEKLEVNGDVRATSYYGQDGFEVGVEGASVFTMYNGYIKFTNAIEGGGGAGAAHIEGAATSAASPAYGFTSYTGTGMRANADDNLRFVTSSTDRVTIDSSGNVGIGTTTVNSRIHGVTTMNAATGNEIAYQLNYTTNKATSGNDTGLLISMTDTASPGVSLPLDIKVGGVTVFSVSQTGVVTGNGSGLTNVVGTIASDASNNTKGGTGALAALAAGGLDNTAFGRNSLLGVTTGDKNTAVGNGAGAAISTGVYNTAIGDGALAANNGNQSVAIGKDALLANTSSGQNVAVGSAAMESSQGFSNVAIGFGALTTGGDYNVALGYQAGNNAGSSSSNNVFIGKNAGPASGNVSDKLYIHNASGTPTIFADFATGNVGIGTTTPAAKLEVAGTATMASTTESIAVYTNSSTAYTIPDSSVNIRRITLTGNATLTLPTFNTPTGKVWTITVFVKQDGTGSRTLAWAAPGGDSILWDQSATAPAPASAANKITIYQFTKPSDETTWYGSMVWKQN